MKRTSHCIASCLTGLSLATAIPTSAFAQTASGDGYAAMLSYLDSNTINGHVAQGMQGISAVNTTAGDANQQANLRAFALGGHTQALLQARQRTYSDAAVDASLHASASIGGVCTRQKS